MDLVILILAAGAGTRMRGGDKLTEDVAGEPLLRRQARAALATGCAVIVVLPPGRPARSAAIEGLPVRTVIAAEADRGMSASLRAGVADAGGAAVMVLPADMPDLGTAELDAMVAAFRETPGMILRAAASDGTPGHPAIFPADLCPALARTTGDRGGRDVIAAHPDRLRLVPLPGRAALTDLDTPEDWAAWRAGR